MCKWNLCKLFCTAASWSIYVPDALVKLSKGPQKWRAATRHQQSATVVENTNARSALSAKLLKCVHKPARWEWGLMWCVFLNSCLPLMYFEDESRLQLTCNWQSSSRLLTRRGRWDHICISHSAVSAFQILSLKALHGLVARYVTGLWRLCEHSHTSTSPDSCPQAVPEQPGVTAASIRAPRLKSTRLRRWAILE